MRTIKIYVYGNAVYAALQGSLYRHSDNEPWHQDFCWGRSFNALHALTATLDHGHHYTHGTDKYRALVDRLMANAERAPLKQRLEWRGPDE